MSVISVRVVIYPKDVQRLTVKSEKSSRILLKKIKECKAKGKHQFVSDMDLVTSLLEESALEHPDIRDRELIEVRLVDFGSSSINFVVLFYSDNVFRIEKVKSDIRKIIIRKFEENNVVIPFKQVTVHFDNKNNKQGSSDEDFSV